VSLAETSEFQQRMRRIEVLVEQMENSADPVTRTAAREMVQALLELYAVGLAKIIEHVTQSGLTGRSLLEQLAADDLIGSLLLLHGLHPLGRETRVREVLDKLRPGLHADGCQVELVSVDERSVRLRLERPIGPSLATIKQAIEEALTAAAPDINRIEIEEVVSTCALRVSLPIIPRDTGREVHS
jgi:Fe-S cluster biogenesis protein NfuA